MFDVEFPFRTKVTYPKKEMRDIVGKNKENLHKLQSMVRARVLCAIDGSAAFEIHANSEEEMREAEEIVKNHISSLKKKGPFTHFVCIPCLNPELNDALRNYLMSLSSLGRLEDEALNNLCRLHTTLLTLRLLNEESINKAASIVDRVVSQWDWKEEYVLPMDGIHFFGNEGSLPKLFYANPMDSSATAGFRRLQQTLKAEFVKNKLIVMETTENFHITLLRYTWIRMPSWGSHEMIEYAKNYELPPARISYVALCKRHAEEPHSFYRIITKADLTPK